MFFTQVVIVSPSADGRSNLNEIIQIFLLKTDKVLQPFVLEQTGNTQPARSLVLFMVAGYPISSTNFIKNDLPLDK